MKEYVIKNIINNKVTYYHSNIGQFLSQLEFATVYNNEEAGRTMLNMVLEFVDYNIEDYNIFKVKFIEEFERYKNT